MVEPRLRREGRGFPEAGIPGRCLRREGRGFPEAGGAVPEAGGGGAFLRREAPRVIPGAWPWYVRYVLIGSAPGRAAGACAVGPPPCIPLVPRRWRRRRGGGRGSRNGRSRNGRSGNRTMVGG